MKEKLSTMDERLIEQNQRLLQHLNTERLCRGEDRQLLSEIFGRTLDETNQIKIPFYTEYGRNIKMGRNIQIGRSVTLSDFETIQIGSDVEIGSGSMILTSSFRMNSQGRPTRWSAPILIKKNVKIGEQVIVQPGVSIGENTVILAGTIVSQNIPANSFIKNN